MAIDPKNSTPDSDEGFYHLPTEPRMCLNCGDAEASPDSEWCSYCEMEEGLER